MSFEKRHAEESRARCENEMWYRRQEEYGEETEACER